MRRAKGFSLASLDPARVKDRINPNLAAGRRVPSRRLVFHERSYFFAGVALAGAALVEAAGVELVLDLW